MKKLILILSLFIFVYAVDCSNKIELNKIEQTLKSFKPFYSDVPNFLQCDNNKTALEKELCQNQEFIKMFKLLSIANIYAYENATKQEVEHQNFNSKHLYLNLSMYIEKGKPQYEKLCYDLKEKTTSFLGGLSPYKSVSLFYNTKQVKFFILKNKHGFVLRNREGYTIYLGKQCDVIDSFGNKGIWKGKDKNNYQIYIGNKKIMFSYDENNYFVFIATGCAGRSIFWKIEK